jgi:ATP-binding cassette subfamily B protein
MSATTDLATTFRDQLPYLPRALRLVWDAAPRWTAVWVILLIAQALLPVALVYLTRIVVDRLTLVAGTGVSWEAVQAVLLPGGLMACLLLLIEVLRAGSRLVRTAQADRVRDHVSGLIHEHIIAADLAQFESPEYHDRLYRARTDSHERPVALVQNLGALMQNALTLAAMAVVLVQFGWWVPLVLVASTAPALAVVARHAVRRHRWSVRSTPDSRRTWYYDWLLCTRESASEIRIFDLGARISDAFQQIRNRLRDQRLELSRAEALSEMAAAGFALATTGALLIWMVTRTVGGAVTLGGLAMFLQAFVQGQKLSRSLLESVGQTWANMLFLENLFGFLAVEPEISDPEQALAPPAERPPSIRLQEICFTYPDARAPVFSDLDLEVPAGSVAALLGANGAGKSTIFKLLCRLYDPQSGLVEIGGTDLRDLSIAEVRRLVTVLFQEPVHFSETVRRNITLGEVDLDPGLVALDTAVATAGAGGIVDRLPDGLDTMLGTWFAGGAELSVGEWQRIALARALLRSAPVLLLDEPTSSMDSWAESEWAGNLGRLTENNRTVILITHRLTTAMHADRIHILDEGRIVESGSHRELLEADGRYRAAWTAQFGDEGPRTD